MEQTPNFVMRCPKCGKDYSPEASYCEACSAMLEPIETDSPAAAPLELENPRPFPEDAAFTEQTRRIARLRSEIENRFALALLLELDQMKQKSAALESAADLSEADTPFPAPGRGAAVETLLGRIARTESMIEELTSSLKRDADSISRHIADASEPILKEHLRQDLAAKTDVLALLSGERPIPPSLPEQRKMRMLTPIAVSALIVITILAAVLFLRRGGVVTQPVRVERISTITETDVDRLLSDVRGANITKNIDLWQSRYASSYAELAEKRSALLETWKRFDYRSLSYRVERLTIDGRHATAVIAWDMILVPKTSGETRVVAQRLLSEFVIEDGMLKIASVRKADG